MNYLSALQTWDLFKFGHRTVPKLRWKSQIFFPILFFQARQVNLRRLRRVHISTSEEEDDDEQLSAAEIARDEIIPVINFFFYNSSSFSFFILSLSEINEKFSDVRIGTSRLAGKADFQTCEQVGFSIYLRRSFESQLSFREEKKRILFCEPIFTCKFIH